MAGKRLLYVDAAINIALGLLLGFYPRSIIQLIGIPVVGKPFYASILGGVLFGIGLALVIQVRKQGAGLGLAGAVAINVCGGICLALWLVFGKLAVPLQGYIIMWALVAILIGLSSIEYVFTNRKES